MSDDERGPSSLTPIDVRWLACAAGMAEAGKVAAQPLYGTVAGRALLGQGAGGDRTLEIDRACEAAMHAELAKRAPAAYRLVSEESGIGGADDAPWTVVVDPLDGSLNAKRGLEPFCASIAVADGPTIGDVQVAYIEDYLRPHVFAAVKGSGLFSREAALAGAGEGARLVPLHLDPSRFATGLVEVLLLEAGRPDRHHFRYDDLSPIGAVGHSHDLRIRQIGSLALSLCYVALGIADVLVAAVRARSVDIAAGLRIVREAGGGAAALGAGDLFSQALDLEKRCAFVAWRAGLDGEELMHRAGDLEAALLG